jgi:hypothetical protein
MTLLSVNKGYVHANVSDQEYLLTLGTYLLKARGITKILMLLGFCLSGTLFYYLLFVSKTDPRSITVWGLIGIVFLFAEVVSTIFGRSLGGIVLMLPMGLNEIFLGIWLIIKGFDKAAISHPVLTLHFDVLLPQLPVHVPASPSTQCLLFRPGNWNAS